MLWLRVSHSLRVRRGRVLSFSSREWRFENNTEALITSSNPVITLNEEESIDVSLKVVTYQGCQDSLFRTFNITATPAITFESSGVCEGDSTQLEAIVTDNKGTFISAYSWQVNNQSLTDNDNTIKCYTVTLHSK